ncbi:ribonuclease H-like domain-containing protein [Candidatus Saganbacteria bacterium]|nr:ribonuclease H-like domain-containing protein [Candidatus Saganbacteria bacterium]
MIAELFKDKEFQTLEKEYKFLSRARGESLDKIECVIFDIETTGLEPTINEITEIGAFKVRGGQFFDLFSQLIKPRAMISPEITRLTGIDNEMVKDCPPIETVLPRFREFIDTAVLIAHNTNFDVSFIKEMSRRTNQSEPTNQIVCTLKLARHLLPGLVNYKLHTVASYFGISARNRHRAIGDVEITFQVWGHFIQLLEAKGINSQKALETLIAQLPKK